MAPTPPPAASPSVGEYKWPIYSDEIIKAWEDGSMRYIELLGDENHAKTLKIIVAYALEQTGKSPPSINLIEGVARTLLNPKKSYGTPGEVHDWWHTRGLQDPAESRITESDKEIRDAFRNFQRSPLKPSPLKNEIQVDSVAVDSVVEDSADEYENPPSKPEGDKVLEKDDALEDEDAPEGDSTSHPESESEEDVGENYGQTRTDGRGGDAPKEIIETDSIVRDLFKKREKKTVNPTSGKANSLFNAKGTTEQRRTAFHKLATQTALATAQAETPDDSFSEADGEEDADSEAISNRARNGMLAPLGAARATLPAAVQNAYAFQTPTKLTNAHQVIFAHNNTSGNPTKSTPANSANSTPSKATPTTQHSSGTKRTRTSPGTDTLTKKKTKTGKVEVTTGYKGNADASTARKQVRSSGVAAASGKPMFESPEKPEGLSKKGAGSLAMGVGRRLPDRKGGSGAGRVQNTAGGNKNGGGRSTAPSDTSSSVPSISVLPSHGDKEERRFSEAATTKSGSLPKTTKATTKNPKLTATAGPAPERKNGERKNAFAPRVSPTNTKPPKHQAANKTLLNHPSLATPVASRPPKPARPPIQFSLPRLTLSTNLPAPSFTTARIPTASKTTKKATPKSRNPFEDTDSPSPSATPRQTLRESSQPRKSLPLNPYADSRRDRTASSREAETKPAPRDQGLDAAPQKTANPTFGSCRPSPPYNSTQRNQSIFRPIPPPRFDPTGRGDFGADIPSGPRGHTPTGPRGGRRPNEPPAHYSTDSYRPDYSIRNPADRSPSDHRNHGSRGQPSQYHAFTHARDPPGSNDHGREQTRMASEEEEEEDHEEDTEENIARSARERHIQAREREIRQREYERRLNEEDDKRASGRDRPGVRGW